VFFDSFCPTEVPAKLTVVGLVVVNPPVVDPPVVEVLVVLVVEVLAVVFFDLTESSGFATFT